MLNRYRITAALVVLSLHVTSLAQVSAQLSGIEVRIPIDDAFRNEDVKRFNEEKEAEAKKQILSEYPELDYFVGFSRTIHEREGLGYTIRIWAMVLGVNTSDSTAGLVGEVATKVKQDYENVKEKGREKGVDVTKKPIAWKQIWVQHKEGIGPLEIKMSRSWIFYAVWKKTNNAPPPEAFRPKARTLRLVELLCENGQEVTADDIYLRVFADGREVARIPETGNHNMRRGRVFNLGRAFTFYNSLEIDIKEEDPGDFDDTFGVLTVHANGERLGQRNIEFSNTRGTNYRYRLTVTDD